MIIGFTGPAGSGKDTAAAYLISQYGFERVSYAAPLKAALTAMGFPEPKTQDDKEAVIPWLGKSWRYLAQTIGTEWGRVLVHPDIWTMLLFRGLDPAKNYVISDVRFENEAAQLRAAAGRIVHLIGRAHAMSENTANHASERLIAVAPGDEALDNSGNISMLHAQIDAILRR